MLFARFLQRAGAEESLCSSNGSCVVEILRSLTLAQNDKSPLTCHSEKRSRQESGTICEARHQAEIPTCTCAQVQVLLTSFALNDMRKDTGFPPARE
jgi:hypothetical protein